MRVAIVDHVSAGGVSRFVLALLTHLSVRYPDSRFAYFVSAANIERDRLYEVLDGCANVEIVSIRPAIPLSNADVVTRQERGRFWRVSVALLKRLPRLHSALRDAYVRLRDTVSSSSRSWYHYRLDEEVVEALGDYDVVYLSWPYFIEPILIDAPIVATFHDFHFKHFPQAYDRAALRLVERQTPQWLSEVAVAVASTRFIRDELLSYYPVVERAEVVYLAPYGFEGATEQDVEDTIERLGVKRPYILYSGGRSAHKNLVSVFAALGEIKRRGHDVQLVITGHGTEVIGSDATLDTTDPAYAVNKVAVEAGLVRGDDYLALGYVSNMEVDALTCGANAMISASLYEAGCGPAMDAWQAGVPVVFSDIPPFREQLDRFGVEAWVFDPLDPIDIADKIESAVHDRSAALAMAARSKSAFSRYTWFDTAEGYYRVFEEAAEVGARPVSLPASVS
jgi:glycosyltransferase involved in cell wall biosynthesis